MFIEMLFRGPVKLKAEEITTGAPKTLIKVRVSLTDDVYFWRTDLFAPLIKNDVNESLIQAGFDVLRGLCMAWKHPDDFRKAAASADPMEYGVHVAVKETDVELWIEAAASLGRKLEEEACHVTTEWWAGKPVPYESK